MAMTTKRLADLICKLKDIRDGMVLSKTLTKEEAIFLLRLIETNTNL